MSVADHISDILYWWPWEIRGLFGARPSEMPTEPDAVLRITRDGILVESGRRKRPAFEPVLVLDAGEAGRTTRRLLPRRRGSTQDVCILVEPGRYLKRRLSAMRLPRSRMSAMALLDVQSATPFSAGDLFLVLPQYDEQVADSSYYAVKKPVLAPLLDDLHTAGLRPSFLGFVDGQRVVAADTTSFRQVVGRSTKAVILRRLLAFGAVAAIAGLITSISLVHWRYSVASNEIDQAIAVAETEAASLRALIASRDERIAQIGAVREEKRATVPLVSIIEEMSRAIPNSTWLTEINVSGNRVSFTGYSASAAALIPLLEASPLFSAPTFMEPVVRAGNQEGERFTIAMQVEAADG